MKTAASLKTTNRGLPKVATGIQGLDEVTGGGLPRGRPTLVCGSAGCGKTLLGMEFLVRGATQYNEPGVFVAFEESAEELGQNVRSLGFDVEELVKRKKLAVDYVRVERAEIEETGDYDLEGLFIRIGHAIETVKAKRVVLDTVEVLFSGLQNAGILRAELRRLFRWLKDRGMTAVITGERGEGRLTRHGLEEYVSDCVILLDHRVIDQVSTRRMRIVKYRGSAHGTNEYPFLIDEDGISVLPITSLGLQHPVSDELRNPLAPIRNAISILRQSGGEAVQETCGMLERQVGLMVRLVDDLLDVSRITRNKIELRKERVELAAVIRQAVECTRPVCASMGHEMTIRLPDEPVVLDGDPIRLTQVFANLLDNACKYMERGGRVSLSAELNRPQGEVAGEVVVRVRDEGIGIAADQLSRIFDMFAQVDTTLERTKSGLGIGLTLVMNLVNMHGGSIEAHSEGPGRGSEFVVRLPAPAAAAPGRQPAMTEAVIETRSYRILVADDNRDSAHSLALLLQLMGHETHTAMDGVEALEKAEAIHPDVVLLDIGMPRLNGYDACRRIREQSWSGSMKLIAQTGWGQEEDRRRTEEAGFDGHLIKPVDPDVLLKLVALLSIPAEP